MKVVNIFVSICAVLLSVVLLIALIVPSDYSVKKEIVINQSQSAVFSYIKYVKNQEQYSAWAKMDPNMRREYHGVDGSAGFISVWKSEIGHVGKGELEVLAVTDSRIDYALKFFEPFEVSYTAYLDTEAMSDNETTVTWGLEGRMSYPMNLLLLVMDMEKELGKPLIASLEDLKKIQESSK